MFQYLLQYSHHFYAKMRKKGLKAACLKVTASVQNFRAGLDADAHGVRHERGV